MLRIKYKNIFMQFMARATLFLWYGLIMFLWASPTYAQTEPYYVVDAFERPGVIYQIENGIHESIFERNSGSIYSVAVWKGQVYFCSANERNIYKKIDQQEERVIYQHTTYIRDIAFDIEGNLYFSEASGANSDGAIYKLERQEPEGFSDSALRVYTVQLRDVDGSWAGHFTFDSEHPDDSEERYLYLSSGNTTPALIYRVPIGTNRAYGSPQRIYRDIRAPIAGIAMEPRNPNFIYYADWGQTIYKLSLPYLGRRDVFSAPTGTQHLSDIAFDMGRET